jgi:hypothetical protein
MACCPTASHSTGTCLMITRLTAPSATRSRTSIISCTSTQRRSKSRDISSPWPQEKTETLAAAVRNCQPELKSAFPLPISNCHEPDFENHLGTTLGMDICCTALPSGRMHWTDPVTNGATVNYIWCIITSTLNCKG